jgi:hypothetical protein
MPRILSPAAWALASTVVVSGCYAGPVFKLDEKNATCEQPFLDWTGGLTFHVLQGNGDGAFDYVPVDPRIAGIDGYYDLKTGEFWWWTTYAEDAHRSLDRVEGTGTIWPDGDMDLGYTTETEWADGTRDTTAVRDQRLGCDVSIRREDEQGLTRFEYGAYDASGYAYRRDWTIGADRLSSNGYLENGLVWTESLDFASEQLQMSFEETGEPDGHHRHDFVESFEGWTFAGAYERWLDGTTHYLYDATDPSGELVGWDVQLDAAGFGTGSWTLGDTVCDTAISQDGCALTGCGSSNGACTLPWSAPHR